MQSVAKRVLDVEVEPDSTSRMEFQREMDEANDDLLDENNLERIFSRPTLGRRKLDLFEAPEFIQRLSSYEEAEVGEVVTFRGQYRAFPKPTVKWFKDEEEIKETKRHNLDLSSESEGIVRLIIQDVIKEDEGAYKCKVENQEGVASTTGYLSVSGKPSDKLQTKKITSDRVSTPPYLRPIAEQKSMEEREEKEYKCLPPSPLQEFMDKIRHSAKTMHEPIVYGNLENLYSDDDDIKSFDEDTEEDVFDENSATPSGSPVEYLNMVDPLHPRDNRSTLEDPEKLNACVHAVDLFISPSVDLRSDVDVVDTANEDSAYDSDSQISGNEEALPTTTNKKDRGQRAHLLNRRSKVALQRSLAIEIPEIEVYTSDSQISHVQVQETSQNLNSTGSTIEELPTEVGTGGRAAVEPGEISTCLEGVMTSQDMLRELCDVVFHFINSPWIQFYLVSCLGTTSLSLAANVPFLYLVTALVLLCIVSFTILEQAQK